MIVDDLNFVSVTVPPAEADTPPIVDSDRILAPTTSLQGLQSEAGRLEIIERSDLIEKHKSPKCGSLT